MLKITHVHAGILRGARRAVRETMEAMNAGPVPIPARIATRERCLVRGERLVRVKFVGLPPQGVAPGDARGETRFPGRALRTKLANLLRVIGRLVAARP